MARAPGGELAEGTQVVTMMGGMGREFDGGYAEYVTVSARQVIPFRRPRRVQLSLLSESPPEGEEERARPPPAFPLVRGLVVCLNTERARRDSNPQPSDP